MMLVVWIEMLNNFNKNDNNENQDICFNNFDDTLFISHAENQSNIQNKKMNYSLSYLFR
jgi:hypothetical protein